MWIVIVVIVVIIIVVIVVVCAPRNCSRKNWTCFFQKTWSERTLVFVELTKTNKNSGNPYLSYWFFARIPINLTVCTQNYEFSSFLTDWCFPRICVLTIDERRTIFNLLRDLQSGRNFAWSKLPQKSRVFNVREPV